uniref:Uncharacterized protein n=1 Tax=Arundo donax TaxID=35708 RepID=A0A0A9G430_ARUDO
MPLRAPSDSALKDARTLVTMSTFQQNFQLKQTIYPGKRIKNKSR